jgi:hypothetical protein
MPIAEHPRPVRLNDVADRLDAAVRSADVYKCGQAPKVSILR